MTIDMAPSVGVGANRVLLPKMVSELLRCFLTRHQVYLRFVGLFCCLFVDVVVVFSYIYLWLVGYLVVAAAVVYYFFCVCLFVLFCVRRSRPVASHISITVAFAIASASAFAVGVAFTVAFGVAIAVAFGVATAVAFAP